MVPIKETVMPHHRDKNPSDEAVIRRLDRWARDIGRTTNIYWRKQRNGKAYFGRGQVQITWRENYDRSSQDAGVNLVEQPEQMLVPVISAKILTRGIQDGRWNGSRPPHRHKGIAHYLPTNGPDDLKNARRTVNLTDKWDLIAHYYRAFLKAIQAGGGV